jgi:hypothetical protein
MEYGVTVISVDFNIFIMCIIEIYSINMAAQPPTLSNFTIEPRVIIRDVSFSLTDPTSDNTNPAAVFTFTINNTDGATPVADISGRIVRILGVGTAIITATQAATVGYTTGEITAVLTVNPVINEYTISPKEWSLGSFELQDPSSNSPGSFTFENLTPLTISIFARTVTLKTVGSAQIKVTQDASGIYPSSSIIASFDVLTSIVVVGTQNQIDLSWNIPTENGATIKNYFFYTEERTTDISPAPAVSSVIATRPAINSSYYSYTLPRPYSSQVLSSSGQPTGIDINSTGGSFNITTSPLYTNANYFDMGYCGEIEVNWVYHNDARIEDLMADEVTSTTMTLSLHKRASSQVGDNRINLIFNATRKYDSLENCYGPMPQNNDKTITDIFTIDFPGSSTLARELKYMKLTDVIAGNVTISSNTYINSVGIEKTYSIIIKSIRIAPFRFPISRDFTSLGFGLGIGTENINGGFSVSTFNALADISGGVLYHMPKMTRPLTDYNKASWTFSWKYAANLPKLITDISYLPVGSGAAAITNLNIPFNMRIRGYSRPYKHTTESITDASYNTLSVPAFLTNVTNANYNTRMLFDASFNADASYNQIFADSSANNLSFTFDISSAKGFAKYIEGNIDFSHTQFVFLFDISILDPSYNAYFRMMNTQADSFQVKMMSQTFTPYQEYRFASPDPTLASSQSLISPTNTLYNIIDHYTPLRPFYRFFDLSNGDFYSYRISSQNIAGTSAFSELLTRRCGSVPNTIQNQVNPNGNDTLKIESERTSNQINIYWDKPTFSGYEIQYYIIQMMIDISGRWINSIDYTNELAANDLSFNMFNEVIVPVSDNQALIEYTNTIRQYTYNSIASQQSFNSRSGLNTPFTGSILNGYRYYLRLASVNELGVGAYSSILSGISFSRPDNAPIRFDGDQIIGDGLVILTWKIPQEDAGSPILNYIIEYQDVFETVSATTGAITTTYSRTKYRYLQDASENAYFTADASYPYNAFRNVYSGYKQFSSLSSDKQTALATLRNQLFKYIIHPRPITLNDTDKALNTASSDLSKNIVMNYTDTTFTYKSNLLTQNMFDLSYIQLKWYYTQDTVGGQLWQSDTSVSFHLSVTGHLEHNSSNRSRDISGIFDISRSYIVTVSKMSRPDDAIYNNINSVTGDVLTVDDPVPATYVRFESLSPPTLFRLDHEHDKGYYLKMIYTISNISRSDYRFNFLSGRVIINGIAPVRTFAGLNTEFTMTVRNNPYSHPLENGKTYLFTITPFNINDFFPDPSREGPNEVNGVSQIILKVGTAFSEPITDMSYSLISTSQGGKVVLQWKYSSKPKYIINIVIPDEYKQDNLYPQEYPSILQPDGRTTLSILTPNLDTNSSIVTYTIPSDLPADIASSNAQLYLKSGRGYHISVSPVQTFIDNQDTIAFQPAPSRNMFVDGTYIIPFRIPLRPLEFISQGYNGYVDLKWRLPDITTDPNYYTTDTTDAYYQYKYFTLERRDVSSLSLEWNVVSNEIPIPSRANGGIAGYQTPYTVSGLENERSQQFRIRTVINNEYTTQRSYSDYTYMTVINNIPVVESSANTVYPSIYPFRPSNPSLRFATITETATGPLNGLTFKLDYPSYNGIADYYECDVYYNYIVSGTTRSPWYGIFDVNNGIADLSYNIIINGAQFTANRKLRTITATASGNQTITVVSRSNLYSYGIQFRLYPRKNGLDGVYPLGDNLYTDYSNVAYLY